MQNIQKRTLDEMLAHPDFWDKVKMSEQCVEVRATLDQTGGDVMALHSHVFYEIIFVTGGCVQYMLDSSRYRIEAGDIMLIPPGISHSTIRREPSAEPYTRIVLWIDPTFWRECVQQFPELDYCFAQCRKQGSYLLRAGRSVWQSLYPHFQVLVQENEQRRVCWQMCLRSNVIDLMANISRIYYYQDTEASSPAASTELIDEVFHYIDANLENRITLSAVAEHFFVSTSTISHLFQKHLGVPFYRCVIQRRLINAKNYILSGTPMREAAERCGFSDYTAFFRMFKKEYGISPNKFKAANTQP
ncbi:MAG: helix-turn-helix transcriptional regulator [Oscillospiraceae bacterium]|nr:helix-turn-helix transcriptional regulator [Oscillospiraceae bacterium]